MSQNPKAGPVNDIDTLLEIGLPPSEGSHALPVVPAPPEKSATNIAMALPPRASSPTNNNAEQASDIAVIAKQETAADPLRPRLRRPEKEGLKRRNRRKTTAAHASENSSKIADKYEPLLGSRPCLHAVWSIRRLTSRSAPSAVAAYYIDEGQENWEGLKQPSRALLPIVRSSSIDWIGAADCTINQTVFQTDIFKGRRSLFRFDSMRPLLEERVYDSKNALLKIIANTFAPKIASVGGNMQGAF